VWGNVMKKYKWKDMVIALAIYVAFIGMIVGLILMN
jgi:hypothetical protein